MTGISIKNLGALTKQLFIHVRFAIAPLFPGRLSWFCIIFKQLEHPDDQHWPLPLNKDQLFIDSKNSLLVL